MKKLLIIFLALAMCVSMCACGGDNKALDNKNTNANTSRASDGSIELTLDNYSKYLKLDMTCFGSGKAYSLSDGASYAGMPLYYSTISAHIKCSALSSNFNYNDIKITVHVSGTYTAYEFTSSKEKDTIKDGYDKEFVIDLDIAGNYDKKSIVAEMPDGYVTPSQQIGNSIAVVAISGTVTPA